MSRNHQITDVARIAISELKLIGEFTESTHAAILGKLHELNRPKDLSAEEVGQLALLGKAILDVPSEKKKNTNKSIAQFDIKVSERIAGHALGLVTSIKQQSFMSEMSLVYTISRLEAFLKDFFKAILIDRPEILKNSNQITWAEALSHSSMKSLRKTLADREADSLGRGSIDDAVKIIHSKANINMANFDKWNEVRECIYRRNLIVHNRSVVNAIYIGKVKGPHNVGDHLSVDAMYINSAVEKIIELINFMHLVALNNLKNKNT